MNNAIVTNIRKTEDDKFVVTLRKMFYFVESYTYDKETKDFGCDMGYDFNEKGETMNDDTLMENIKGLRELCECTYDSEDEDCVPIYELHSAMFESEEIALSEKEFEDIDEAYTCFGEMVEGTDNVVYRVAVCTDDEADEVEKVVGTLNDYLIPTPSEEDYDGFYED